MATLSKADIIAKYNSSLTGLFKDNTTNDISEEDMRDMVTDFVDSILNKTDESYTAPFPQFTTSTSTTAYVGSPSPSITAYATGQKFQVKVHATSTGAATLNLSGVGAKKIFVDPTTQATTDDLLINQIYIFFYDAALDSAAGGFLMVGGGGGGSVTEVSVVTANGFAGSVANPTTTPEITLSVPGAQAILSRDGAGALASTSTTGVGAIALASSPVFGGTPTAPTAAPGTDTTQLATTAFVQEEIGELTAVSNSATGTTDIDCNNKRQVCVHYTTTVTGAITITVSNAGNLEVLNVIIPITGANIAITTPSTTRMPRRFEVSTADGWYQSTKILQVSSVGTADLHELSFKRASAGPTFILHYDGPTRA